MTFKDWIFSVYPPNSGIDGAWGTLHILTLVFCILAVVALTFLFRNKDEKTRRTVLLTIAGTILFFEISRRVINLIKTDEFVLNEFLRTMLPRPWCAISCWVIMIAAAANKKFLYNYASTSALLCAIVFFAYPGAGFNHKVILFENVYSIVTHSCLLIGSLMIITLRLTDFNLKTLKNFLICVGVTYLYGGLEILFKIEADPQYFMPGNEIQEIVGITSYPLFLVGYILFIAVYFGLFYLSTWLKHRGRYENSVKTEE